jgi:Inhibitor of growth proteins N-terminal histone-binding
MTFSNHGLELQQEIDKDSARYIRHSLPASSTPTTPLSPSSLATNTPISVKISASYAEIQELATEKCALAQQLIELLLKTRARLDIDIVKVKMLQGDSPDTPTVVSRSAKPLAVTPTLENLGTIGRNPALAISESLRNALALTPVPEPPSVASAASSGPATKSKSHLYPFFRCSNIHRPLSRTPSQCHKLHQNNPRRNTGQTPFSIARNSDFNHDTCDSTEVASFTSNPSSC